MPRAWNNVDVQAVMAWNMGILLQGEKLTVPPETLSDDPTYYKGRSDNMRLGYAVQSYVCGALRSGPLSRTDVSRRRLLAWLDRELRAHGGDEPLTSSHGQLWLGFMGAALNVALRVKDAEVADRVIEWKRVEYALYSLLELPDMPAGDPWTPGGRGLKKKIVAGICPTRKKWLASLRTGKPGGRLNQTDSGAWYVAALPASIRERIRTWPARFPPTWGAFHGARFSDGSFYGYFESLPRVLEPVLSAGCLWPGGSAGQWIDRELRLDVIERTYSNKGAPVLAIDTAGAAFDDDGKLR